MAQNRVSGHLCQSLIDTHSHCRDTWLLQTGAQPLSFSQNHSQVQGEHLLGQLLQQLLGQECWQLLGGPGAQQVNVTTKQAQIAG